MPRQTAYDTYRFQGGTLEIGAFYAQALHQTAQAISIVRAQPVSAARNAEIQRLWVRFQVLADEYRAQGGGERAILDFINRVHDTVVEALKEVPGAVSAIVSPVIWPLAIVAAAILFIYLRGARRG